LTREGFQGSRSSINIASTAAHEALRKLAAELYQGFLKAAIRKLTDSILVDRVPKFLSAVRGVCAGLKG
jgi:hypothetical protein